MALASDQEDRAQAVYRTVVDGLGRKCPRGHLFDNLANDYVHRAFALARGVSREAERQKQFLRFQELESGLMYARTYFSGVSSSSSGQWLWNDRADGTVPGT